MSILVQHYIVFVIVGVAFILFIFPMIRYAVNKLVNSKKTLRSNDEYTFYSSTCGKCARHKS